MNWTVTFAFLQLIIGIRSKATFESDTAYVSIRQAGTSVSTTCDEPNTILVDLTVGEVSETHTLNRVETPRTQIPLFLLKKNNNGEKSIEEEMIHTPQDGVQYKEATGSMMVKVTCASLDGNQHFEMLGFVTLADGVVYKLEPREREKRNSHHNNHRDVYDITEISHNLGDFQLQINAVKEEKLLHRDKRDTEEINIDVVTLVGYSVYQRSFQRSIESTDALKRLDALDSIRLHFGLLFNSVARRFTSANPTYKVRLVGCVIEDEEEGEWVQQTRNQQDGVLDGNFMLESIWNWTTTIEDFPQNDVIVTYELMNLYSLEANKYLYDFSKQSSICTVDGTPVVLVRFRDLVNLDVAATAHGLGRAFGALDDGPPNNCSSDDHYIMSSDYQALHQIGIYNPYYFSPCSIQYFQEYIDFRLRNSTISRSCLLDSISPVNVTNVTGILPGEVYNPDDQCRLVYGAQSYYCFNQDPGLDHKDTCKRLHCYYPADARCYPLYGAEGTTCGNKKWCMSGECVYSDDAPSADDECVHGDQIYITGRSLTCPSVIASYIFYCYYTNIETMCCKSCKERRGPDEGCQYGDNRYAEANCQHSNCNSTTTYKDTCCETCSDYRTSTSTTEEQTMSTTMQTTSTGTTSPTTLLKSTTLTTSTTSVTTSAASSSTSRPTTGSSSTIATTSTISTTSTEATTQTSTATSTTTTTTPSVATTIASTSIPSTPLATSPTNTLSTSTPSTLSTTTTQVTSTTTSITTSLPTSVLTSTVMTTPTSATTASSPSTSTTTTTPPATTAGTTTSTTTTFRTSTASTVGSTTYTIPTSSTSRPVTSTPSTTPVTTSSTTRTASSQATSSTPTSTTETSTITKPTSTSIFQSTTTTATSTSTTSTERTTITLTTTTPSRSETTSTSTTSVPTITTTATTRRTSFSTTITTTAHSPATTLTTATPITIRSTTPFVSPSSDNKSTSSTINTPTATTPSTITVLLTTLATKVTTQTIDSTKLNGNVSVSKSVPVPKCTTPKPRSTTTTIKPQSEKSTLSDKMKLGIGLGVGISLAAVVIIGVVVYKLRCNPRNRSANFTAGDWTSLSEVSSNAY